MKQYEVAVLYDNKGKVILTCKCKMVDDNEFKRLMQLSKETLDSKDRQVRELNESLKKLSNKCLELEHEIKVLKGEEE